MPPQHNRYDDYHNTVYSRYSQSLATCYHQAEFALTLNHTINASTKKIKKKLLQFFLPFNSQLTSGKNPIALVNTGASKGMILYGVSSADKVASDFLILLN